MDLVCNGYYDEHLNARMIKWIRGMMRGNWCVKIIHTYREGNRLANKLDGLGLSKYFRMVVIEKKANTSRMILENKAKRYLKKKSFCFISLKTTL